MKKDFFIPAFTISFLLHTLFIFYLFYQNKTNLDTNLGAMQANGEKLLSITILSHLPQQTLKEYSQAQQKSQIHEEKNELEKNKHSHKEEENPQIHMKKNTHNNQKNNKIAKIQKNTINSDQNQKEKDSSSSIPIALNNSTISSPVEGISKAAIQNYQSLVMAYLSRYKKYPKKALKMHIEGKIKLKITLDKDGYILKTEILEKAHEILNQACIDLFIRVKKLPPPPKEWLDQKQNLIFKISIDYNISSYKKIKF